MEISLISLPKIEDPRGNLAIVEKDAIPFAIKRVYYLFDVPSSARRGGHAHKQVQELLIPVAGSFDVILDDGKVRKTVPLNKPDKGLLIAQDTWRELENFSAGSVCLVLASDVFTEEDYIRDYDEFIAHIQDS